MDGLWIIPLVAFCIVILKYFLHALYAYHSRKLEEERLENLARILRNNPLELFDISHSSNNSSEHSNGNFSRDRISPPPDFDSAIRNSILISRILPDDDLPPPTYDECYKEIKTKESESKIDIEIHL